MAIDSTLFGCQITAAAHAVGDIIPLGVIAGPANVRSGRGAAILKNIQVGRLQPASGTIAQWRIHVRNSDWIDDVESYAANMQGIAALSPDAGMAQVGHDCNLTANSGWQVFAECVIAGTDTAASSLFALIDIDYPSVSAVQNPEGAVGVPTSITFDTTLNIGAVSALVGATWSTTSVDYFKAGYQYCLEKVEAVSATGFSGFVAFSNAAGMGGLQRIIPIASLSGNIRYPVKYASTLNKGPMDVKLMLFADTAATGVAVKMVHDYVKRGA